VRARLLIRELVARQANRVTLDKGRRPGRQAENPSIREAAALTATRTVIAPEREGGGSL